MHDRHEHEHDLGLAHDLKVLSRRRMFHLAGAAGVSALVAACAGGTSKQATGSTSTATTTTAEAAACAIAAPAETAGPYPGDGSNGPNVLIESGIVRSDIRSSFGSYSGAAEGVPTTIELTLQDITKNCTAGAGMAVYIWHCDRAGNYSLYSQDAADQNYLRGVQVADQQGRLSFTSIFPACYPGRWPHIHFEVFDSLEAAVAGENARLTSQIALPEQACTTVFAHDSGYADSVRNMSQLTLDSDNVFGDGWDAELANVAGDPTSGMTVSLTIGVGEKSTSAPPNGGPPPGGPPPR
ncbi:dioxygenase [Mycobacterium sp.]|uniref:dioxygenase family protein n=1 Tax=Mycobacterium sp. TaxID=1785 RepID=UPI002D8A5CC5|nr:dioxygenase [Mycobacterium sp.]